MLDINRDELSEDELERIQETLRTRFVRPRKPNVLDVGFGIAYKNGKPDKDRGISAVFFVKSKGKPGSTSKDLPKHVKVRFLRDSHFHTIIFQTDVVESKPAKPSGAELDTGTELATTGIVMAWRVRGESEDSWGLLTVGHAFPSNVEGVLPPNSRPSITIRPAAGSTLTGELLWKGPRSENYDAAVVAVTFQDLVDSGILSTTDASKEIEARSPLQLIQDEGGHAEGFTIPEATQISLRVEQYLPRTAAIMIPMLGVLKRVIRVSSAVKDAFKEGRSGSAWVVADELAAMQVATAGDESEEGYGHAVTSVYAFVKDQFADNPNLRWTSFRLVAFF
jgi:hypothetical protein